jgi:hypothetical protein
MLLTTMLLAWHCFGGILTFESDQAPGNHVTLLNEMHLPKLARLVSKSLEQLR